MISGRETSGQVSRALSDARWDAFLQSSPLGHFQQSSLWAQVKAIEGWHPIRFVLTVDGRPAGGFQILTRQTMLGSIGYISKGPVVSNEDPVIWDYCVRQIIDVARSHGLRALIMQQPDGSRLDGALLARHGFLRNHLVGVISATLLVDLSPDMAGIEGRMRKSTLMQVKRARRRGVVVREGGAQDLHIFYSLMAATCVRQRTRPAPAESALAEIWRVFHAHGGVRLTLAECEGEPVAGMLCLRFGRRVTAWKKGWSGKYPDRYPNHLLTYEAIQWAQRTGSSLLDFSGMSRELAEDMAGGMPLERKWEASLDWFILGFGNRANLLPESRIYISSALGRFLYRLVSKLRGV